MLAACKIFHYFHYLLPSEKFYSLIIPPASVIHAVIVGAQYMWDSSQWSGGVSNSFACPWSSFPPTGFPPTHLAWIKRV